MFLFFAIKLAKGVSYMKIGENIEAIFFDLDGTLLPLDQFDFLKQYFRAITAFAVEHGISSDKFSAGMVAGIEAMTNNDGSKTNMETYWEVFCAVSALDRSFVEDTLAEFYADGFKKLREFTNPNPLAVEALRAARKNGRKVVLATSPVFPEFVQLERLSWIGLSKDDFDLVTNYENSNFCKPHSEYYLEICQKIGVAPENCLMIGNDENDDMRGASKAGMSCFLVTDHRILSDHFVWTGERGTFEQMVHLIERI